MPFLADTNVLLRLLQRGDPNHAVVRTALRALAARYERIYYVSQNLVEFWRVCTRPASVNGLGMSVSGTDRWAGIIERLFLLATDRPEVHTEWRRIVVANSVSGIQVHDARIVAAMRVHGLTHLLTLNVRDFSRYSGITVVHPLDV
jgi:predicted nucleic acid-binding protein